MKYSKIAVLLFSLICALTLKAEITPEKRTEIDKLLRLTGMEKLMDQMKGQMIGSLKSSITGAPAGFWEKFSTKMDTRELIEKIVPIYDKYYTIDDLKAVNEFYSSPAGQKILGTLPQVMQESMKVGQAWGQKISQQASEEAAAEAKAEAK
jgi:hypothetical protein